MNNFGIFVNPFYKSLDELFGILSKLQEKNKLNLFKLNNKEVEFPDFIKSQQEIGRAKLDCIFSCGGDGTFLKAVEFSLKYNSPLLGINLGKLGFLSESSLQELEKSIDDLKNNRFELQERLLLKVTLKRDDKQIFSAFALNDVVINKGELPKLIDVRVSSNRRYVMDARCDGIIAATPTGSTAYSVAAGGPILDPEMEALIINPICPFTLSNRPIVVSGNDVVRIEVRENQRANIILSIDGQEVFPLKAGDTVILEKSHSKTLLVRSDRRNFYEVLRSKLNWSGGPDA
jgi:NAD+ kinase